MKLLLKLIYFTLISAVILLTLSFIGIQRIDKEEVLKNISAIAKDQLALDITIEDSKLKHFPIPFVELSRIKVNSGIFIDKATVNFDLFSLFYGGRKVSYLKIDNIYVNPNKLGFSASSYKDLIYQLNSLDFKVQKLYVDKIWDTAILNGIVANNFSLSKSPGKVNYSLSLDNGIIISDNLKYNSSKNLWDSSVSLSSETINSSIKTSFNQDSIQSGDFKVTVNNLANFVADISGYYDFIFNKQIKSNEKVEISGVFSKNSDSIALNDMDIKSQSVKGKVSLKLPLDNSKFPTLLLELSSIDLNKITTGVASPFVAEDPLFSVESSKLLISIVANSIKFAEDNIYDFRLSGAGDGKSFVVSECTGSIDSGGNFDLSGQMDHNQYRPIFSGKLSLSHGNLNSFLSKSNLSFFSRNSNAPLFFKADVIATPIDFNLKNLGVILSNQSINGECNIKMIAGESLVIGDLDFEDLDIDKTELPIVSNVYEYIKSLSYGMSDQGYSSKFIPLRKIPIKGILSFNIDNFTADSINFKRVNVNSMLDVGQVAVESFVINKDANFIISGAMSILAGGLKPIFKLDISGGNVTLTDMTSDLLNNIVDYTKNNLNFSVVDFSSSGYLNLLQLSSTKFSDVEWTTSIQKGALSIDNLEFNCFEGSSKMSGNLVFNPVRINLGFGFNSINLKDAFAMLPSATAVEEGFTSVNGQFSSTGNNVSELANNSYIVGEFLSKDLTFNNLDMLGLIQNISKESLTINDANTILQNSMNSGHSSFDTASGNYELNSGVLTVKDISIASKYYTGSAGLAVNLFDWTMDLNSYFLFYPAGAKIYSTESVPPIKLNYKAKGTIFSSDKTLNFVDPTDITRISRLIGGPSGGFGVYQNQIPR